MISPWLFPSTYNAFSRRNKANWDIHVVSLIQSTLVSVLSFYAMYVDKERSEMDSKQRVWGYTGMIGMVQAFGAGYFIWDLLVSAQYVSIFGVGLLVHAICALAVFMLGFRPFVNYYAPVFLLYELSSPFLNFHWFMDKLQMTGSLLQLINGLCLLAVFFGCRLVFGTYSSYRVACDIYSAWANPPEDMIIQGQQIPTWLAITYALSNFTLNCLNFYWFSKMIDALRRRFESQPVSQANETIPLMKENEDLKTRKEEEEEDGIVVEGVDIKVPPVSLLQVGELKQRK